MSMTEPSLSSLAGITPPNPVLAVISGNLELEPLIFSFNGDFLTKLFVTSGMEFRLLNLKLVFMVGDDVTNPLVTVFSIPPPILKFGFGRISMSKLLGPFDSGTFSLVLTKDGWLKLKCFSASDTTSALSITDFGTENLKVSEGLMGLFALALIIFAATSDSTFSVVLVPLALVELTWLGFTESVEIPLPTPDFCFLGESHFSFSSITLFKGHLLLFLSIISGDSLGGRIDKPLVVVGGDLVAEVVEKLRTGIVSTLSWGSPDNPHGGEGGASVLLRSALCRAASVTFVFTLKLDFALLVLGSGKVLIGACLEGPGGAGHVLGVVAVPPDCISGMLTGSVVGLEGAGVL